VRCLENIESPSAFYFFLSHRMTDLSVCSLELSAAYFQLPSSVFLS
jgi:hypothetical protein